MECFGFIDRKEDELRIIWEPVGQGRRPDEDRRLALSLNLLLIRMVWEDIKGCRLEKLDDVLGLSEAQRQTISYLTRGKYNREKYTAKKYKADSLTEDTKSKERAKTLNNAAVENICKKMAVDIELFTSTKRPGIFKGNEYLLKLLEEEIEWLQLFEKAKEEWDVYDKEKRIANEKYMFREILREIIDKTAEKTEYDLKNEELKEKNSSKGKLRGKLNMNIERTLEMEDEYYRKNLVGTINNYLGKNNTTGIIGPVNDSLYELWKIRNHKDDFEKQLIETADKWYKDMGARKDFSKVYFSIEKDRHKESESYKQLIGRLKIIYSDMTSAPKRKPESAVDKIVYFLRHENVFLDDMAEEIAKLAIGYMPPKQFWDLIDSFDWTEEEYKKVIDLYRIEEAMLITNATLKGFNVQISKK